MKNQTNHPNVFVISTTNPSPHTPEKLSEQAFYLIALSLAWKRPRCKKEPFQAYLRLQR